MEYKNIIFWDLSKHTGTEGSLKKNLESLGCNVLKGDFDREKAVTKRNDGKKWAMI